MDLLAECLKRDEGYRNYCHLDPRGFLSGGWGHHFVLGGRLSDEIWEMILKYDIAQAVSDYDRIPKALRDRLNTDRARVIVCMIYNMGLPRVLAFHDMWAEIERQDWQAAHDEMLDSAWHEQVGERADRLAQIMLTGVWGVPDAVLV